MKKRAKYNAWQKEQILKHYPHATSREEKEKLREEFEKHHGVGSIKKTYEKLERYKASLNSLKEQAQEKARAKAIAKEELKKIESARREKKRRELRKKDAPSPLDNKRQEGDYFPK